MALEVYPYDSKDSAYLFIFHPMHSTSKSQQMLSIITNLFLSVVSGGLWLIPFFVVNRLDAKKFKLLGDSGASEALRREARGAVVSPPTPPSKPKLTASDFDEREVEEIFENFERETEEQLADQSYLTAVPSRFIDILCPEATAITCESNGAVRYLHANLVQCSEGRAFIAAQVPEYEHGLFWLAATQHSDLIVDLTADGDIDPYYPHRIGEVISYPGLTVTLQAQKELGGIVEIANYVVEAKGTKKEIARIHYKNWRDHCATGASELQTLVEIVNSHSGGTIPIVHCRAGVGRTGTFIAASLLLQEEKQLSTLDKRQLVERVKEIVAQIRKARGPQCVQRAAQFRTLLEIAIPNS